MSVKLLYGSDGRKSCTEAEKLGGFCYCRLNPTGKAFGDKIYKDDRKVLVDLAKCAPIEELTKDNPIEVSLDFGIVPVESRTVRDITLYNSKDTRTSMWSLPFVVDPREELMEQYDKVFHVLLAERLDLIPMMANPHSNHAKQSRGYADAQFKFRVLFKPKLPAIAYTTTLCISIGKIPIKLKCHGFSEGPFVAFSQNVINFGGQYYGSESSIHIDMMNHSICDADFQFDSDNFTSVYKICPMSGTIPASATMKLEILFRPHKPQTFYKRVYCLLHHQNPQYIDLIGVCIPRPFFVDNPIDFCVSSQDTQFLPLPSPTFEEYFQCDMWGIKLSQEDFNFGGMTKDQTRTSIQEFSLTSSVPYDVLIEWVPDPRGVFAVFPQTSFLNANQSATFTVSFSPPFPENFYAGQLECYIYPTTYIWPPRDGPPWVYSKRQRDRADQQSTASTAVQTSTTTYPAIEFHGPVIGPDAEKFVPVEQEEYEIRGRHSSLETTTDTFKGPPSVFGGSTRSDEYAEQGQHPPPPPPSSYSKKPEDKFKQQERSPFTPPPTKVKTPRMSQGARRINFQLYVKNGSGLVLHSIVANKHYHSVDLSELERLKLEEKCGPMLTEVMDHGPGDEEGGAEEQGDGEEEEEGDKEEQAQLVKSKSSSKKKGKKGKKSKSQSKEEDVGKGGKKKKGKKEKENGDEEKSKSEMEVGEEGGKKKKKKGQKGKGEKSGGESETELKEKFIKEHFQSEDASEMESLDEEDEGGSKDVGAGGDNLQLAECAGGATEDQLEKREGVFSVPEQGREPYPAPMELALPLCLTIRLAGHTYANSTQPPVPHFSIPPRVLMSPTLPMHREFRTILMKNTSDLPILFDIKDFDKSDIYSAKPLIGLIPGEEKQILMISMNTTEPYTAPYQHTSTVTMNVQDENQLSVFGYAEVPSMTLTILSDPSNTVEKIICPTTIPGYATSCEISMKNPSRFHYRFLLEFAGEDPKSKSVFTPTPPEGIIAPYDSVKITWKFVPYAYTTYNIPWRFRFEVMGAKSEDSVWNAVYEVVLPLFAIGGECHLRVDPEILDFDLVQIFDTVSKTFTITNDGESVVKADLLIFHEQWLQWYNKEQIQISPSQIYLKSGEKIEVKVTVRPDRPIMYRYTINYALESSEKDPDGNVIFEFQPAHLIDVLFMGDHAIAKITHIQQIAKHPAWNVNEAWEMFSLTQLNTLMTPLRHTAREGSLPEVQTVSFRFPDAPVGSPPAIFSLVLTNLTSHSKISEYWRIHTQPPRNNKLYQLRQEHQKESFIGTDDAQDAESFLTALWTTKYREIEGELGQEVVGSTPWRRGEQHQSLTMAALKNGENFLVTPSKGTIDNGKEQVINFKFNYSAVGEHRMPVLLRVYPAIFVWLELRGKTLQSRQSSLQLLHNDEMIFHPIGLSDLDPPIQSFWMYNGGVVATPFKVDMEPFKKIKGQNFGHACIECLTPESVALPKAWTQIKLRFAPLEFKTYTAPLRIRTNNEWQTVQLRGKPAMAENVFLHPVSSPRHSEIFDPFVPIVITPSRIVFPHYIPTGDKCTSLMFITNLSAKHSMSFAWPETTVVNSAVIKFLPDIGILAPKEQCACQVIIEAGHVNQILSTTIRCWIEDVTAVNRFHRNESLWRGELVEFKEVTVVTKEKGPHRVSKVVVQQEPNRPSSFSRLLGISCYIGSVFGTLDNIQINEQAKMTFSDPTGVQPLPGEGRDGKGGDGQMLVLSPFNRHLAKDILSQILWDLTLLSPNWPNQIRNITKRQSVYYDDYKRSEASNEVRDDMKPKFRVPQKLKEDVLEFVLFTILQECADNYGQEKEKWFDLKPSAIKP